MANSAFGDYTGSLTAVYISNYSDIKMLPLTHEIQNSTLFKALVIAAGILYTRKEQTFFGHAIRGSGSWAIGNLLEPYIRNHIQHVTTTNTTTITPMVST